jgi:hypothetical protein
MNVKGLEVKGGESRKIGAKDMGPNAEKLRQKTNKLIQINKKQLQKINKIIRRQKINKIKNATII